MDKRPAFKTWFVLLLACACCHLKLVAGQDSFYFSPQPRDQTVNESESVTLECGVSNQRHISFYWTLNGKPVQNSTRRHQDGSNLRLNRVDRHQDIGEFKCIALNATTGISMTSQGAQLNIQWIGETAKVHLHSPESEDLLTVGGEMVLRCKLEGSPEVSFQWYRNGLRLFRNERISFRNSKRLHINPLTIADNGVYSCRGKNEAEIPVSSSENFALRLRADDVAIIEQLPSDVTAMKNRSARFDCVYDNAATTEWYAHEQDVPLANNTRYAIYPNGSLLIQFVRNSDEGIYRCVGLSASSKDAPQQTYTARLKVAYLQEMGPSTFEPQVEPDEMNVIPQDSQYEVTCIRPKGHPNPRVWWEDPSGHVISDNGRIRADETLRLIVERVKTTDSGNYTCVAENEAGQKRQSFNLIVTVPPSITQNPVNLLTDEGEMALITCKYTGSPYPMTKVHWLREGKYLRSGSHSKAHMENGTLVIPHVSLADVGNYTCEVNTTGFAPIISQSAALFVKEKLKFLPTPVNKNLELGKNSKIHCKARGSTPPLVKWIIYKSPKSDRPVPPAEWPSHIRDENGTLHFSGVQIEDAGKYTCVATSSQGIINVTIRVEVIVLPKFTVPPANTEAYEGYSSMLHCQADGDPKPTIQWDKNGALNGFDQKRFHVMPNGTLYISEVHKDDNGKYGCTAGNSGGFKRDEVSLLVHSAEHLSNAAEPGDENTMTKTVAITLGAAAVYMLLVLGLLVWCRMRRAKRKAMFLAQANVDIAKSENGDAQGVGGTDTTELKDRTNGGVKDVAVANGGVKNDGEPNSPSSGSHTSKKSRSSYDRVQFPRHDLQKMMLLGKGEFGDVYLAKAKSIKESDPETVVMVKALQVREETAHVEFKREMELYHKLTHENLVKLMGVCREAEPFLMIVEYSDWGDLKQFLLATRKDNPRKGPRPPPLSLSQIIGICHQVAIGMEFISNHRFTHKDLATRNCLISSKLDVKISSPSLSKDTYAPEYHRYKNKSIPLRWMPPEAVFEDEYSTKSDVWAFAVLVWETFTQAELPFVDVGDETILGLLQNRELVWSPPDASPDKLRELLTKCWNYNAKERPSFTEAVSKIGELTVDSHL